MGIPICLYEQLTQRDLQRYDRCPAGTLAVLKAVWEGRRGVGFVPRVTVGAEWTFRWRFELQIRVLWPLGSLIEWEAVRSKDSSHWLFYKENGSQFVFYEEGSEELTVLRDLEQYLEGSRIASVDCWDEKLVLGLDSGQLKVVTWKACDGIVQHVNTIFLGPGPIQKVFTGLLPRFVVSYSAHHGLLCSDTHSGVTFTLLRVPRGDLQVALEFPRLTAFNESQVWHSDDVLREPLQQLEVPLRPEEHLLLATPCDDKLLVLETDRRLLSLSGQHCQTIFHKTEAYCQVSCAYDQVVVAEQHLYGTTLTVYEYSPDQQRWISLGYSDIRAKYNITKVLRLALLSPRNNNRRSLVVLADDGSIQSFNIECS